MRVGASRTAPEPRNLSSTEPHSPRLRNPNQLRRGERYPLHTAPKWGQSWTPIEGQSSTPIDRLARIAAKYGPEITLRDLLDRFSYDCLWRTQSRTKRGHTDCGVYLPDLEHKRPPDLPAGMVKLRLVKKG
jgi:hypothetical protein